jgi:oxygen-independent coproporphyrinogen-3 oxidase
MALENTPRSSEKVLTEQDLCFEYILNIVRLKQSFNKADFEARTRLPFGNIDKNLNETVKSGLMTLIDGEYSTTEKGWAFLNDVMEQFL